MNFDVPESKGGFELDPAATGDEIAVPLTAAAREVIASLPHREGAVHVFEHPPAKGDGPGKPYLLRTLYRALADARITTKVNGKTIHDLRRTYATRLLNGHVSPALIAALLGQRTTRLVGRYTHAEFETLRAAAALGAVPPQVAAKGVRKHDAKLRFQGELIPCGRLAALYFSQMERRKKFLRNASLAARFAHHVDRGPRESGCWLWTGSTNPRGYGQFCKRRGHPTGAHRVAWEIENGPIPPGAMICHHCDVPACVNPEHLFLGDARLNGQDASEKGRLGTRITPHIASTAEAMARSGRSLKEIARATGVGRIAISAFLRGERVAFQPAEPMKTGLGKVMLFHGRPADVRFIRTARETGAALARRFRVSESTISRIRSRELYRQID
jgi:hypothetical protein